MNIVTLAGRLGKDAEKRFTPNNQQVISFSLATTIRRGGKDETQWWRISCWGADYDRILPYLKKGSGIIVVGEITKIEIYNDKEGRPQVSVEVRADSLKFSPFGNTNPERSNEGAPGSQHTQKSSQADSMGGFSQGMADPSYFTQGFQGQTPATAQDPNEVPF